MAETRLSFSIATATAAHTHKTEFHPENKMHRPGCCCQSAFKCEQSRGGGGKWKCFAVRIKSQHIKPLPQLFFFFRSAKWFMEIQANRCSPAEQKGYLTDPIALPSRLAVPSYFKCTHTGWSTVRHKKCKECPWKTSRLQLVHKGSPCANRAREFLSRSWPGIRWGD